MDFPHMVVENLESIPVGLGHEDADKLKLNSVF